MIPKVKQITEAQRAALRWFREHGGDGMFDNNGVLLAAGELAPHMRSTWEGLCRLGFVQFYSAADKPRARLRLTRGPGQ